NPITIELNIPDTPTTTEANQVFCQTNNPTVANLSVNETNVVWYDAAIGGNLLAPTVLLIDGETYYAAQVIDGCEGERLEVNVKVRSCKAISNPMLINKAKNTGP